MLVMEKRYCGVNLIYEGYIPGTKYENLYWYLDEPGYNAEVADEAVEFFGKHLTHTSGRWAGMPFNLLAWQEHRITRPMFGILREQPSKTFKRGIRRIREVYCEIPKKNGKSEYVAGVGNKLLRADGEIGAQIYSAAGDKDQASIIHNVSAQMVRNNEELSESCQIKNSIKRIIFHKHGSYYQALSADVPTKHGFNSHGILFDELHAQPNANLWDVLTQGSTVARVQPLIFAITTAGWNRESICWKKREYALKVMKGVIDDPEFLPIIYGMDADEDWENEENWWKVNPSMNKIFTIEDFRKAYQVVREMPHEINNFRRLRLNQWTKQETRFIPMAKWDKCSAPVRAEDLIGRVCYGGCDLATVSDFAAWSRCFPLDDGSFAFLWNFYIPEDTVHIRIKRDKLVDLEHWIREGYVTATPGSSIDYDYIMRDIETESKKYDFKEIGCDPWNARHFITEMTKRGFVLYEARQGYKSMSSPMKDMLALILDGKIRHGNNPVARWMADNLAVEQDAAGNVKPHKGKSTERIDGIVAMIIALDCARRNMEKPSVYEERGIIAI